VGYTRRAAGQRDLCALFLHDSREARYRVRLRALIFPVVFHHSMMARGDLYAAQRHFVRGSLLVQRTQLAIPAHLRPCETGRTRRGRTCSRRRRVEQHQLLRRASGCCMGTGR
jgi:hypothetical protein